MKNSLNKNLLICLRNDKEFAIKRINLSIKKWEEVNSKNNFFSRVLLLKELTSLRLHWTKTSLIKDLYKIDLIWSKKILRSITNVKKDNVILALEGIKNFYLQISTVKPNLAHPDILDCYNETARKNLFKLKKKKFKEIIEVNILDPFANILGIDGEKLEKALNFHKNQALKDIEISLNFFDDSLSKLKQQSEQTIKYPKNYSQNKNNKFEIKLIWCNEVIKVKKNLLKKDVKKTLIFFRTIIQSFNVKRPNFKNVLIKKMYKISLEKENLS